MNKVEEREKMSILKAERDLRFFLFQTNKELIRPAMYMSDGLKMSVQASTNHYSIPRRNFLSDYDEFEVGFPNQVIEQLRDYAECPVEDDDELLTSVYPFVPKKVIIDIIREHGGLDFELSLNKQRQLSELKQEKNQLVDKNKQAQEIIKEFALLMGNILEDK